MEIFLNEFEFKKTCKTYIIEIVNWVKKIKALPTGYSEMSFAGKKYGVTRKDFNNGKSTKIYAKEAGGNHFISCNCYFTEKGALLKPCEMPEKKVIYFLEHAKHWINKLG